MAKSALVARDRRQGALHPSGQMTPRFLPQRPDRARAASLRAHRENVHVDSPHQSELGRRRFPHGGRGDARARRWFLCFRGSLRQRSGHADSCVAARTADRRDEPSAPVTIAAVGGTVLAHEALLLPEHPFHRLLDRVEYPRVLLHQQLSLRSHEHSVPWIRIPRCRRYG